MLILLENQVQTFCNYARNHQRFVVVLSNVQFVLAKKQTCYFVGKKLF
jgi:hypothetical protein